MRHAAIATLVAALCLSAHGWAQQAEAPIPQPRAAPVLSQPRAPQRPRIEMPGPTATEGQGSTEPAQASSTRRRPHIKASRQVFAVNRAEANAFTAELNRRELRSLGQGGAGGPEQPWRELYPYR